MTRLVVIGASWGGLDALVRLLPRLEPDIGFAVVVTLHRSPDAPEHALVDYLGERTPLPVREAEDKDALERGHIYVAPPDYHVIVEPGALALSTEERVRHSRPSIDVLFESAADVYGDEVVAVLLTGANADGADGLRMVRKRGGRTIVQDPATAVRREMPDAGLATGVVDDVLPIEDIADLLNRLGAVRDGD